MKYADSFRVATLILAKFQAQSKMNVIQSFTVVKLQGHTKHYNYKEQQKILEAFCRYYKTFCKLEATGKSVFG